MRARLSRRVAWLSASAGQVASWPHQDPDHLLGDVVSRGPWVVVDDVLLRYQHCEVIRQGTLVVLDEEMVGMRFSEW
jgi:hypothetical protein